MLCDHEVQKSSRTSTPSVCISAWDGSVAGMDRAIKAQLKSSESYNHKSTLSSTSADGRVFLKTEFSAKNSFGVALDHTATGWMDPKTCRVTNVSAWENS